MRRPALPLLAATGLALAGVASALLLHDHHFVATLHYKLDGARSYRYTTIPPWRDPLALVCAFGAIAVAVLLTRRLSRVGVALGVLGCAFAGAVYVHQAAVHTFVCPPGLFCPGQPLPPSLWSHPASLLIIAAGMATAVLLLLPRRWLAVRYAASTCSSPTNGDSSSSIGEKVEHALAVAR